jgi:hypothetical protein
VAGGAALVLAIAFDAAMPAHDQTPQEPLIRLTPSWAEVRVITRDALCSVKQILIENGWYWDLDPFLWRSEGRPRALSTTSRRQGLVAVVEEATFVRRIFQHFAEASDGPHWLAGRAGDAILIQTSADTPHGVATGHKVIEDALHHRCFCRIDLQVAGASRTPGDTPVTIRHQAMDNLTSTSPEKPPAAIAFSYFGALIFGDHTLHLNQQRCFRIIVKWGSIHIVNLDTMPGQLVGDQDLIGIAARQAVRRQAPDMLDHASFGSIAECVQTRPVKTRSRVAIVRKFLDNVMAELRHLLM